MKSYLVETRHPRTVSVTANLLPLGFGFHGGAVGQATSDPGLSDAEVEAYRKQIEDAEKAYDNAEASIRAAQGSSSSSQPSCTTAQCKSLQTAFNDAAARAEASKNAATADANRAAKEYIAGAASVVSVLGGAVLAPFIVGAGYAAYEAQKWIFSKIFGQPDYYSDEAKASAQRNFEMLLGYGYPVPTFDPAIDVNPLDYDERVLQVDLRLIAHRYEGYLASNEQWNAFSDAGKAIGRQIGNDPIIIRNVQDIALARDGTYGDWIQLAGRTDDIDPRSATTAKKMIEIVGLAAARENVVPLVGYGRVLTAATAAWNKAIDTYGNIQVRRDTIYPSRVCGDSCAGLIPKGAVVEAVSEAWLAANRAAKATNQNLRSLGVTAPMPTSMPIRIGLPGGVAPLGAVGRNAILSRTPASSPAKKTGGAVAVLAIGLGAALLALAKRH